MAVSDLTFTFFISAPNTGLCLRLQQLWAMFTKRFYNSLRFYGTPIQIFVPVFFVLLGNVLAIIDIGSTSTQQDDPNRVLSLENSALFDDKLTLFYAQFGDVNISNTPFLLSVRKIS